MTSNDVTGIELDLTLLDAFLESSLPEEIDEEEKGKWKAVAILKEFLMDPPQELLGDDVLKQIESMLLEIVSIISSFDLTSMDDETSTELMNQLTQATSFSLPVWLFLLKNQIAGYYELKPKPSREDYPTTWQIGFIDHLAEKLEQLLKDSPHSICPLRRYILPVLQKLQYLSPKLVEIPQSRKEDADVKDLIQSTTNLAYEVEYVIDACIVKEIPTWYCMSWFHDILEEFEIKERQVEMESGFIESIVRDIIYERPLQRYIVAMVDKPQGHHDIKTVVSNTKISDRVGKFFYHPEIRSTFEIRTWSRISSDRVRKKDVFMQLLINALPKSNDEACTSDMDQVELERLWYERLSSHSRYLVILEDVRDIDALNDIVRAFPNWYGTVLVITPLREVAIKCRYFSEEGIHDKMPKVHTSTSQMSKPSIDNNVVGFVQETRRMVERLTGESKRLCIISIVGMAGQGKTTLAMKLFNDPTIVKYFHIRLWCHVSQVYQRRTLLLELLGQVFQCPSTILDQNVEELAEMLYKHLKGRTFLVLLDDVWTVDAWDDIRRCFPNDNNGSRIMFTTRIEKLATETNCKSIVQQLGPLSHEESWKLLKKKLFPKESCPQELLEVGKKIAESCKGLPLSVVLIAGFLEKIEKSVDKWEHIANTLRSRIVSDAGALGRSIIEMSYKHLPDHLRPCFLYFGAFLEDREVPVSKLMRLWIAEGFIKCIDSNGLEDVAEDYLMDLIGRSLVTVVQQKSNFRVKVCHVHDLLHEFCFTKAKEENFLEQRNGNGEQFPPSKVHVRRLCVHSTRDQFVMLDALGTSVRSLLFFATSDLGSSYSYDISFIFRKFKLITILDLENIEIGNSFEQINLLDLLRYLAVKCYMDYIPSSIAKLWNLETFVFKGLSDTVVKVPYSILDMAKLRHVHISQSASFDLMPNRLEMSSALENLQTFSTLSLTFGDAMEKILRRSPRIRKLKCISSYSWDGVAKCNQLPQLGFLSQLVSLRACYHGDVKFPYKFNLPSNLKKLTLANFRMQWNEISQFGTLANLEVLKLESNAFDGETWEMEDEVFPKLKFLKLDALNLVRWSCPDDNFPCLEQLVLHKCEQLEEIPPNIGENTLQMIKVMWCNPSVATFVKEIQEERLDFNNEVKILIHPKVWDLKS